MGGGAVAVLDFVSGVDVGIWPTGSCDELGGRETGCGRASGDGRRTGGSRKVGYESVSGEGG